MKKMHWYLIKAFLGPFFLTFGIAMIVLILQFLWLFIDELVGKGLERSILAELLLYTTLRLVPMAVILAVLLASVMSFGNLGEHNELTSMKASGISVFTSMKPILVFVSFLAISIFFYSNNVIPVTNLKFRTLMLDIRRQSPAFMIKDGTFNDGIDDYSIKVDKRSKDGKTFYGVMIYDHSQNVGNAGVTVADSCFMNVSEDGNYLVVSLFDGFSYIEQLEDGRRFNHEKKPLRRDEFSMQKIVLELPGNELVRSGKDALKNYYKMLNMKQLADTARAIQNEREWRNKQAATDLLQLNLLRFEDKEEVYVNSTYYSDTLTNLNSETLIQDLNLRENRAAINQALIFARLVQRNLSTTQEEAVNRSHWVNAHWIEWHRKLTMPFACFVFFLIGAPLGAIIKKGGLGMPVVISLAFFISWYIISLLGEKYGRSEFIPVWLGMWGSGFLLLPLGIFLTIKSSRDSAIMNSETYLIFLRRLLKGFKS